MKRVNTQELRVRGLNSEITEQIKVLAKQNGLNISSYMRMKLIDLIKSEAKKD